eukprot:g70754.t1
MAKHLIVIGDKAGSNFNHNRKGLCAPQPHHRHLSAVEAPLRLMANTTWGRSCVRIPSFQHKQTPLVPTPEAKLSLPKPPVLAHRHQAPRLGLIVATQCPQNRHHSLQALCSPPSEGCLAPAPPGLLIPKDRPDPLATEFGSLGIADVTDPLITEDESDLLATEFRPWYQQEKTNPHPKVQKVPKSVTVVALHDPLAVAPSPSEAGALRLAPPALPSDPILPQAGLAHHELQSTRSQGPGDNTTVNAVDAVRGGLCSSVPRSFESSSPPSTSSSSSSLSAGPLPKTGNGGTDRPRPLSGTGTESPMLPPSLLRAGITHQRRPPPLRPCPTTRDAVDELRPPLVFVEGPHNYARAPPVPVLSRVGVGLVNVIRVSRPITAELLGNPILDGHPLASVPDVRILHSRLFVRFVTLERIQRAIFSSAEVALRPAAPTS